MPNLVYSPTRGLELHLFLLPAVDEAILSVSAGLTLASEDGLRERARFLEAAEGARRALPPSPSLHTICFIRDKWNFNEFCPLFFIIHF